MIVIGISDLASLIVLAQAEGGEQGENVPFFLQSWPMLVIVGLMFYFIMILPERRKRTQMKKMLDSLKKNDRVVTIGGIYGVVVNLQKDTAEVTIRVDEGTNSKLRVRRSAISEVLTEENNGKKETG